MEPAYLLSEIEHIPTVYEVSSKITRGEFIMKTETYVLFDRSMTSYDKDKGEAEIWFQYNENPTEQENSYTEMTRSAKEKNNVKHYVQINKALGIIVVQVNVSEVLHADTITLQEMESGNQFEMKPTAILRAIVEDRNKCAVKSKEDLQSSYLRQMQSKRKLRKHFRWMMNNTILSTTHEVKGLKELRRKC